MIRREAGSAAEVHATLGADGVSPDASIGLVTAVNAVASCFCVHGVMILGQCCTTRGRVCCALRPSFGRQTFHEFVSERHPEG